MNDRQGPYRTAEPVDGDLVPTVAQCRRGFVRAAETRKTAKQREQEAWERYLQDEREARLRYLREERETREKFSSAGKEMQGWRFLAQGCHGEEFSPARPWQTKIDLNWERCFQLQDETWMEHSVESPLKAFRSAATERDETPGEVTWTEQLEELWRCYRIARNGSAVEARASKFESAAPTLKR
jgi:hypothetical protein